MNSIWNKNISNFIRRFPLLAKNCGITEASNEFPPDFAAPLEILPSKLKEADNFLPTAKENGKFLHSAYNPLREAEQAANSLHQTKKDIFGAAFFSAGLGYTVLSYARLFPNDTIIVVESDPRYFFTALSVLDWTDFFNAKNVILALGIGISDVVSIIEKCGGFNRIAVSENLAQSQHAQDYFSALHSLIQRNKHKSQINASTLEKFSSLWLKNSCRNLHYIAELDGVNIYKEKLSPEVPALVLAAGPTLEEVLPHLKELKKRTVIIAVDTALRACLKAKVEPDFIILADPQYYAYRHIAGLSSPSSILITESAAYPAVYRFNCKKIVMCSSMFPLGQFVESKIEKKGTLSAGGSVSTTAWDFARLIGAKKIYCAGLDLGYPENQTHIKGSTFEEKVHTISSRLSTAEKSGIASLFGANMEKAFDYAGNQILTDNRMKMFAWWFESKQEEFSSQGIISYTLSEKSLKIPGYKVSSVNEILAQKDNSSLKNKFFGAAAEASALIKSDCRMSQYQKVLEDIKAGLEDLYKTAKSGVSTAEEAISNKNCQLFCMQELEKTDKAIMTSQFKDVASLVFPTEAQLNKLFEETEFSQDQIIQTFQRSKIIYRKLMQSVRNYQKMLFD